MWISFPPELFFSWVFLSFQKIGIHCAIVPFSLVLHSEMMRQLITIWLLSTFTKFLMLLVEGETGTDGDNGSCQHGSKMTFSPISPHVIWKKSVLKICCTKQEGRYIPKVTPSPHRTPVWTLPLKVQGWRSRGTTRANWVFKQKGSLNHWMHQRIKAKKKIAKVAVFSGKKLKKSKNKHSQIDLKAVCKSVNDTYS